MEARTNLRALRFRHHISLAELAAHSGLSKQYISRAELGEISATGRLETQIGFAVAAIIAARKAGLQALEKDYVTYRGRLLKEEGNWNEQ